MHAPIAELLSLRDGEPVEAGVREHVESCAACTRALEDLKTARRRIRSLAPTRPRDDGWARIERQAFSPAHAGRRRRWPLALAASIVIAAAGGGLALYMENGASSTAAPVAKVAHQQPTIAQLQRRSSRLESMVNALSRRDAMMSAGAAGTIANLEDSIAAVDYRLNRGARVKMAPVRERRLWRQRVNLMQSLVTVRYAQSIAPSMD
jgi:hypothetical protein